MLLNGTQVLSLDYRQVLAPAPGVVALLIERTQDEQVLPLLDVLDRPLTELVPHVHQEQIRDRLATAAQERSLHLEAELGLDLSA